MKGFPKLLATPGDVANMLGKYPAETKAYLQMLVDNRFVWVQTGEVIDPDTGVTDATHRVIGPDEDDKKWQMELQEDANCHLFRALEMTVVEAQTIIGG